MKKRQKEWIIFIILLIIIFFGARELYRYKVDKKKYEYDIRLENSSIKTFQDVLQSGLDEYIAEEKIIAVADTDEKMKAYRTLDEIIDAGFRFYNGEIVIPDDKEYDSCFEDIIRDALGMYIKSKGKAEDGRYIELVRGKKYWVWVLIQGSYKEGYTVLVEPAIKDPFSEIR